MSNASITNAMSVDVEDFFQVSAFSARIRREDWDDHSCRVEANTEKVLSLFSSYDIKATFFVLGWVAERYPNLVRQIVRAGHELGSHGYSHFRVFEQNKAEFRADVSATKKLLEDIGGCEVRGYRAASFSINDETLWALEILAEEGYRYSSSIYPIHHDHYGMPDAPRFAFRPIQTFGLVELPLTTVSLFRTNLPCGGGGYFRLLPYPISRWALRRVNATDERPCIFYFHPWEVDPGQPKVEGITARTRFRHYTNLGRMEGKLRALLADFAWDRIDRVYGNEL